MNQSTTGEQELVYHIDGSDQLCGVSAAWSQFALANDGAGAMPERVLGRPLWDFIKDTHIRELYRKMIHRVRSGNPAQFDYRCDAPEWRRQYRMTIRASAGGTVEFISQMLWKEPRPRVDMLDVNVPRSEQWVRVCSWCQKVVLPEGCWVPVEEAVEQMGLLTEVALPRLTHGICPPCHLDMMAQLTPSPAIPAPSRPAELLPPNPERIIFKQ